jgi:adenylylsulfate kinase-like enzyme
MVLWLTGLSGAGKSTIANEIVRIVKPNLPGLVLIDGDVIRNLFGASLGYEEGARKVQILRLQQLAQFLSMQDIPVIVSALYSHPDLMQWNLDHLSGYFEVYVNTPFETVMSRDTKGLYAKVKAGDISNVVGFDIPWHVPKNSHLVIETTKLTPEAIAYKIIDLVPALRLATTKTLK